MRPLARPTSATVEAPAPTPKKALLSVGGGSRVAGSVRVERSRLVRRGRREARRRVAAVTQRDRRRCHGGQQPLRPRRPGRRALEAPRERAIVKTTARFQWRLDWSSGRVSRRGLDEALTRLTRRRPGEVAIVACHHPLLDDGLGEDARTSGGADALAALAAAGADAVLSGHVHDPFDREVDAGGRTIRLIGAGTLSERTRTSPPSFNELRVADGALEVVRRSLGETGRA